MSGGAKQTATPTSKNTSSRKRKRPRWQRSLIAACAAILLLVGGKLVDEALSRVAPQVLDHLPDFLNALRTAPLWAQVLGLLGIGALAFGVAWLILANRREKQDEETEQAEQDRIEQGKLLDAHVGLRVQEMDTHVTEAIGEVVEELKRQQQPPTPAMPSKVNSPSGLPRATTFVGREQTLADLLADLRKGSAVGVFALAGMGGVGKTALAAEAVAVLAEEQQTFPGGVAWIACEDLRGQEGLAEVWTRVARALDASDVATLPDAEQRRAELHSLLVRGDRRLLALDNVDALEAGPLLEILAVQGHTALLLTARKTIYLPGLVARSLDILPAKEAEALFAQILTRSSPHNLRPTLDDRVGLPGLVADLGGLPLAIELTATYAGRQGLKLGTVRKEIAQDGVKAAPFMPAENPQQRVLVLRFDRSWQALAQTPHQQEFFAGLSLLKGDSFPRAAALALATEARGKRSVQTNAASDLAALVDYALVEALSGERYRLHPLLRDYAEKRLDTDYTAARERLGAAMVAFWLDYAREHPGYDGMDALEAEAPGLMGALEWAHSHSRYLELLDLAYTLRLAWDVRGRRNEELRLSIWAVQAAQAQSDSKQQRWAAHQLAITLDKIGQQEEARAGFERALLLARQLGDTSAEQAAVHELAVQDTQIGRLEEARAGFERALLLAQQLGDPAAEWPEVQGMALLDRQTGRLEEARAGYERGLALVQQLGDPPAEAEELRNFGLFLWERGEEARGHAMIERSLAISKELSDVYNIGKCHQFLGWIERDGSNIGAARTHFNEALRRFLQVESPDAKGVRRDIDTLTAGPADPGESLSGHRTKQRGSRGRSDLGEVFISYSHKDASYLERLQAHLRPHMRSGAIRLWADTELKPGDVWKQRIEQALGRARVALLLVSVDYLASEFLSQEELPALLTAAAEQGIRIVIVILTPSVFRRTPLARFQAVNDPGRPLSTISQHEQDLVWERVVDTVLETLDKPPEPPATKNPAPPASVSSRSTRMLNKQLLTCQGHTGVVADVAWAVEGTYLASAGEDGTVRLWDATNGRALLTCQGDDGWMLAVAWAPDGTRLASASRDGTVRLWNAANGRLLLTCQRNTGWVNGVAWAPDGTRLASASDDGAAHLWDAASGRALLTCQGDGGWMLAVAWAPDGKLLASAGLDGAVQLWDAASGSPLLTCRGDMAWVNEVAWAPDGKWLASAGADGKIRIWNATSGRLFHTCQGHDGSVMGVAWAPDGRRLASASLDQTVRLWDAASGKMLLTCQGHTSAVWKVTWAPDGRRLASAGRDETVRVWYVG